MTSEKRWAAARLAQTRTSSAQAVERARGVLAALSGGTAFAIAHLDLDPGLRFQLGVPVASGVTYTNLHVTHAVGDATVTIYRAALTNKKVIVGFTYDQPADKPDLVVCSVSLTSHEGDTFREFAGDYQPEGVKGGVSHGSIVLYFSVVHLQNGQGERHLRLLLQPCGGAQVGNEVAFDFTTPLQ